MPPKKKKSSAFFLSLWNSLSVNLFGNYSFILHRSFYSFPWVYVFISQIEVSANGKKFGAEFKQSLGKHSNSELRAYLQNWCLNNTCRNHQNRALGKPLKRSWNVVSLNSFLIEEIAFWRRWRKTNVPSHVAQWREQHLMQDQQSPARLPKRIKKYVQSLLPPQAPAAVFCALTNTNSYWAAT